METKDETREPVDLEANNVTEMVNSRGVMYRATRQLNQPLIF